MWVGGVHQKELLQVSFKRVQQWWTWPGAGDLVGRTQQGGTGTGPACRDETSQ